MFLRTQIFVLFIFFISNIGQSQTMLNSINQASYDNFKDAYNYTYWVNNWMATSADRNFVNHTSSYAFDIDYTNLNVNNLLIDESPISRKEGFHALHTSVFPSNYQGAIGYSILQNGMLIHNKSTSPTSNGIKDSQMAEYGVWRNTRFVGTNFTDNAPVDPYFTGVEFSTWHNRFKLTFHVKPTVDIVNGQLRFTFTMPAAYTQYLTSGDIHAFGLPSNKGFAVKAGSTATLMAVNGNQISIFSTQQNLIANQSYEISLLFYALTGNLSANYATAFEEEEAIQITGTQTAPNNATINNITYDSDQGVHFIEVPRVNMGYFDCAAADLQQRIDFELSNTSSEEKRVRLCIFRNPSANVTGFNSLICNANGDPAGLPLQISKNWHTTTDQLYSGNWINEYTEIILPANTTLAFQYKSTGAKWGETYSASSHQLSVAGAGVTRGGWLEAALGTFGESITHSPDYQYGNTNGADIRPFLVTNQAYGQTSSECGWTGNSGGIDMWVYKDESNIRRYQSQVKTDFKKYSPNLTETSISAISSDEKLKLDYTFYLNRSDDFNRVYYKIKIKALENTSFSRFDIFQLGGDNYNVHNTRSLVYGNDAGLIGQFQPTNSGSNNYTTAEIALAGDNPWVWAGDGLYFDGVLSGIDISTNNGMIIRDYNATFNGQQNNTPYFRERSSSTGFSTSYGTNPTSYCLVPPPGVTSFSTGDSIELLLELAILPKQAVDYYGPNQNFTNALTLYGNSHEVLLREAAGNQIIASSSINNIDSSYPLTVATSGDEGIVTITGGRGYIPLVFSGLSNVDNPTLWMANNSCWELVDQSVHGKDFWQAEYNENTGLFDLIFNVNQDRPNDLLAYTRYFLGETPPELSVVRQSQILYNGWTIAQDITVEVDVDSLILAPQVIEFGTASLGLNDNWQWTGPNGLMYTGRVLTLYPVGSTEIGTYTVTYTDSFGCSSTESFFVHAIERCDLPANVTATVLSGNAVKVDWDIVDDATKYRIQYRIIGSSWLEVSTNINYRFLNSLTPNSTYEYRIKTVCDTEASVWSIAQTFTTNGDICDRPEDQIMIADITSTSATISWLGYLDDQKYKFRYRPSGGDWIETISSLKNYNLTGLIPNKKYFYKVKTKCTGGWTQWTSKYNFTTLPAFNISDTNLNPSEMLNIRPNPAFDKINVEYQTIIPSQVIIYNTSGQILHRLSAEALNNPFDISDLESGMYFLSIIATDGQTIARKFCKAP